MCGASSQGRQLKRARTLLRVSPSAVGGVVVPPLSNGLRPPTPHPHHGAQHLCLSGTFAPDKQGRPFTEAPTSRIRAPGITEVYFSPLFLASDARLCKDERRLPRPGVQLPRGRIRGKMSSLLYIFFRLTVERSAALL